MYAILVWAWSTTSKDFFCFCEVVMTFPIRRHGIQEIVIFRSEHVVVVGREFIVLPFLSRRVERRNSAAIPLCELYRDNAARTDEFRDTTPRVLKKIEVDARYYGSG